jgi:hypothetical protein
MQIAERIIAQRSDFPSKPNDKIEGMSRLSEQQQIN